MKITRRQLRQVIKEELSIVINEGNDEATYSLVTEKIIEKLGELAGEQVPTDAFTYEIYKGQKGSYYQFNIVDKQFHMEAQQSALKQNTNVQREASKIIRKYLSLDESGRFDSYSGTNDYHSWKLK